MNTPAEQWGVDWFEIISEDYFDDQHAVILRHIAEQHRLIGLHGVSLNIGGTDLLDFSYLNKLRKLAKQIRPVWISDHLCWTGVDGIDTHDLLPVPLTWEAFTHIAKRINDVQDYLNQSIVLENPSCYVRWRNSEIPEWRFLEMLTSATGCQLLLDVNNVYVSSVNLGFDPECYITDLPARSIAYLHLAGHAPSERCLIDTHDRPVADEVWKLYQLAQHHTGGVPVVLEWDSNIPSFPEVVAELNKARGYHG